MDLNTKYDNATIRQHLDKVNALGEYVWKLRNHTGLPDEPIDVSKAVSIELKADTGTEHFMIVVVAHNITAPLTAIQFKADFPGNCNFTKYWLGTDFPDDWTAFAKTEDGHPKEGLFGAYTGTPFTPPESCVLATLEFEGPDDAFDAADAAEQVALTGVKLSHWGSKHTVLKKTRIFPL